MFLVFRKDAAKCMVSETILQGMKKDESKKKQIYSMIVQQYKEHPIQHWLYYWAGATDPWQWLG